MEIKLQKREEEDRKEKEEDLRRREEQKRVRKDKEDGKGVVMKRNERKQQERGESVKERKREDKDKKMENKEKTEIRLEETIENEMEKELGHMKGRKEKEKERKEGLKKEKIDKGKIEKTRNVLVMAIVLEQMLGLLMKEGQNEANNEEYGMWPEERRENTELRFTGMDVSAFTSGVRYVGKYKNQEIVGQLNKLNTFRNGRPVEQDVSKELKL